MSNNEFDPLQEYKKVLAAKKLSQKQNDSLEIDNFINYINISTHLINKNLPPSDIQTNNLLYTIAKNGLEYANDINDKK